MDWKGEVVVQAGNKIKENINIAADLSGHEGGAEIVAIDDGALDEAGVKGEQYEVRIEAVAGIERRFEPRLQRQRRAAAILVLKPLTTQYAIAEHLGGEATGRRLRAARRAQIAPTVRRTPPWGW